MIKSLSLLPLIVSALYIGSCYADRVTYSGFALFRCLPQTIDQVDALRSLMNEKRDGRIDFWTEPKGLNRSVDIMVSPEELDTMRHRLRMLKVPNRVVMQDVGEVIDRMSRTNARATYRDGNSLHQQDKLEAHRFFTEFHPYSVIEKKLKALATRDKVVVEQAGLSYEKRKLYLVKVSSDWSARKPVIFVDAGHHAREWISHSTLLYLLESLINEDMPTKFSKASKLQDAEDNEVEVSKRRQLQFLNSTLDKYDFWFVPVVNPDGYDYSHTTDRLWRKTRSRGRFCPGVDPNRNYPFHWRESGASPFPCHDIYAGPKPLSEPETRIVANILEENKARIVMYLSLHAYSQIMLVPYGYAKIYPDNYNELKRVANAGMTAISSIRGTTYRFGPSAIVLYEAAGGSDDFAHGQAGIKLAYTIELPDTGDSGFLLPASEIIPVGEETAAGITAMVDAIGA